MNRNQLFLTMLLAGLCLAAVPGLTMRSPDAGSRSGENSAPATRSLDESLRKQLPRTNLNLTPNSARERERIKMSWKLNVNEASREELQELPGVGPAYSKNIIDYRQSGNNFYSIDDLTKISGIGDATVERIRPHATVGSEYKKRSPAEENKRDLVDVNQATAGELQKLPGVGKVTAQDIISYRKRNDGFDYAEELKKVSGIGPRTFKSMKDLVDLPTGGGSPHLAPDRKRRVDINSASRNELMRLPRVGPARAERIIEYRNEHGPFERFEELEAISGIGPVTVSKIKKMGIIR